MQTRTVLAFPLCAMFAAACGPAQRDEPAPMGGIGSVGQGTDDPGADDDNDDDATTTEQDEESDTGGVLDVGVPEDRDGCLYVDLLFVIDNSGSMCDAQQGLADTLPGLIDTIWDTLPPATDIHVGIVTTSFSDGGSHQERDCLAIEGPTEILESFVTDAVVPGNGYQGRLFEHESERYFAANTGRASDRESLKDWFSGAAVAVGCDGGAFEFPAAAAAYVFNAQNAEYNAGFVRDAGAALGIFVLSNEVDHSPETMTVYHDAIAGAKSECGGDACIVTAGLLSPMCVPSADPVVWQFLNAFGSVPQWGDILDFAGYDDVVSNALAGAIVDTCEEVTPVG